MTTSLLKFARSFERLKLRLRTQPAGDMRLMYLVEFWPGLAQYIRISGYRSYFDEFMALLFEHAGTKNLSDLLPSELKQLLGVLISLSQTDPALNSSNLIKTALVSGGVEMARKSFYAGAVIDGLNWLTRIQGAVPDSFKFPDCNGRLSEIDILKMAQSELRISNDWIKEKIDDIIREWELVHEAVSFEEANCVFIERSDHDDLVKGRLRCLHGSAEYRSKVAKIDEVTFENQIKAPDDPFVGAVYGALEAVSRLLGRSGMGGRSENRIRARFGIADSDHTFTGDSIGLAAALITYTQLLKPEILKHERFIACEAVFTGGVDASGDLQPVNDDTLREKIRRAFFSPARYMVLPRANLEAARDAIAKLQSEYSCRRLLLIGEETLAHVIENLNIIRAEKVCTGRYVMRKAHRYGRLAKIQIPLLLLLLYVLACIVYPKAWIGFDRNPAIVRMNEANDRILVFNQDSDLLWSRGFDCSPVRRTSAEICDLDSDGRNEVLYLNQVDEEIACPTSTMLSAYDNNGDLLFTRMCHIVGEYPGDTSNTQHYMVKHLYVFQSTNGPVIVTDFVQNSPARSHLKIWSPEGELLGWYIHSGHIYNIISEDVNGDGQKEVLGVGINNRAGGSGLFILPAIGSYGVSPPYRDVSVDLSSVKQGNQLNYVLFPTSDLALADSIPYGGAARIAVLPGNQLRVDIQRSAHDGVWRSYYLDSKLRVYKVSPSDIFWARRQKFVEGGYLPAMDIQAFREWELGRVRYWSKNGWTAEPPQENSL